MTEYKLGTELPLHVQEECKRRFVHRFTRTNVPAWARANPNYKPQFADDADWLAHTRFAVRKNGELDGRVKHCESAPTWPDGKGIDW